MLTDFCFVLCSGSGAPTSDIFIDLDRTDATYSAGDVIRGHVNVNLTRDVKMSGMDTATGISSNTEISPPSPNFLY